MTVPYYLAAEDGRIVATGRCALQNFQRQARAGLTPHLGEASAAHYHDAKTGERREREAWTAPDSLTLTADGLATVTVTGIPAGSLCMLAGPTVVKSWIEDEGAVQISTTVAGGYTLVIDPPRHAVRTVAIEATP